MEIKSSLPNKDQLPESFAIYADNLSAISVTGEEADKYLQGQLTCDVGQLADKHLLVGGHCDAKGKMFAAFRLINHDNRRLLIQTKNSLTPSMKELQKFGVFAKVNIEQANDLAFLALVGSAGKAFISDNFHSVPDSFNPVVSDNSISIIYICGATNRYLLVGAKSAIDSYATASHLPIYKSQLWTLLEITSGFVDMNVNSVNEYVPQMLNLHLINGISFTKGCYLGQETVARMKYLGKNKRALFALKGQGQVSIDDDSLLEKQLAENWRRGGNIIASYQADDGTCYLQAVLNHDTTADSQFRLKDQNDIKFNLMSLPYSLTESEI